MDSQNNSHTYLAMWDCNGLEILIDVTEQQINQVLNALADKEQQRLPIRAMLLRARFNSQRNYEIYTFDSELSYWDIIAMFKENPQVIVNTVREVGNKIYSDRVKQDI
jgi:hypothetical protein